VDMVERNVNELTATIIKKTVAYNPKRKKTLIR